MYVDRERNNNKKDRTGCGAREKESEERKKEKSWVGEEQIYQRRREPRVAKDITM